MKVEMKLAGVDGILRTLQSLPPEIVSKRGGPVKAALGKGARFIRDEAKKNLRAAIAIGGSDSTGLLEKNVVAARSKFPAQGGGERYTVHVRRRRYPGEKRTRKGTRALTTQDTAVYLEYGTENQPATQWLRPTVTQNGAQCIEIVTQDLVKRVDKVVTQLAARNR